MSPGWCLPRLVAHRGGGKLAPENTLAGLRVAAARGYRAVEFDVMLSADGVPVLIHDETLQRTTDGRGRVCETPFAALRRLDAGAWFGAQFAGERMPTLDEALALCRELGLAANVEIKPAQGHDSQTGRAVAEGVLRAGDGIALVLSSFSLTALREAQKVAPDVARGLLFGDLPVDWLGLLRRVDALSVHCRWSRLREESLAAARAAAVPVVVYTCDEPAAARRLFDAGVASVITDRPDLLGADQFAGDADL